MEKASKTTEKSMVKASAKSAEFSVIFTGGKQYKVSVGDVVTIQKIVAPAKDGKPGAEAKVGDKITFDKVVLWDNGSDTSIGAPYIAGAKVIGTLSEIGRAAKIEVIKYKQKSRYFKRNGHRQPFFKVTIDS